MPTYVAQSESQRHREVVAHSGANTLNSDQSSQDNWGVVIREGIDKVNSYIETHTMEAALVAQARSQM